MNKVTVYDDRCKGCGLCIEACPINIIELAQHVNKLGYHPAVISAMEKCSGCTACARMCPDVVLEVFKEGSKR